MTAVRQTFTKGERLRASADITLVLKTGRRASREGLSLTMAGNGGRPARAGFIVRRRIGGAVARNLMKRRMREAYRRLKPRVSPGADRVFSANAVIGYVAVSRAMEQLLEQSGGAGGTR